MEIHIRRWDRLVKLDQLKVEKRFVRKHLKMNNRLCPPAVNTIVEISRKRTYCDEIDGDWKLKKQRNETSQSDYDQVPNVSKRTRDRSSPSYCSSSAEVQKKRYKNNDILSSLSSSMVMSTPKRSLLNTDTTSPTKVAHLDREKDTADKQLNDNSVASQRQPDSSRVGTSNSDLPLHRPTEQIKPVIKSMSDGYVPKPETSKVPKLTLFNKDYSKISAASDRKRDIINDNDEYSVSIVVPKSKTSTLFSGNKNRNQKSKLEMMLSFLRGDESKDEVDSVRGTASNVEKPSEKNDTNNKAAVSSTPANLTTNTSVTFSTATTTSVLNAPSDAIKTSTIEAPKNDSNKPVSDISKAVETNITQSSSFTTLPTSSAATTTMAQSQSTESSNTLPTKSPTVTFNIPSAQTSQPQAVTTSSETTPRLGGFSFSGTPSTFTSPSTAKPAENAPKSEENKLPAPTFSFGLAKSTASTTLPPPYTAPTFGAKIETSTPATQTTSAPVTFNFGSPASKPSTITTSVNIAFGTPSSSIPSAANPTLGTNSPSMFNFGASANPTTSTAAPSIANTSTTTVSSTPFAFGTNALSASVPSFGFGNTSANTTTTASTSLNQSTPALVFGSPANVTKPDTSAFQFGNNNNTNVTTAAMTFGSVAANNSQLTTSIFGAVNTTNANTTTATPSTFSFGANKPATDSKPSIFGTPTTQSVGTFSTPTPAPTFGASQTNPIFGSITNPAATTTASATTGLFGSAIPAQNTPIFGSNNTTSTQPKVENAFGMSNPNNSTPVFGSSNPSNTFGSSINPPAFGSTNNVFGSAQAVATQPQIGSSTNLFSAPATTTQAKFGSTPGVFTFGQNASQTPATTASTGIFGGVNTTTNTNSPFVFGQNNSTAPAQSNSIFGTKPAENANTNSSLSAPPAFGSSTSPAFNFTAKPVFGAQSESKPQAFSFNSPSTAPATVSAFGSAPAAAPQFGNTNGIGTAFSFNATNNTTDAAKPFNFGAPATAPAAQSAFSFNAPNATMNPTQNAFQFNAQQPPTTNIFSIGPGSGTSTTKTGRPMRTATRRIK